MHVLFAFPSLKMTWRHFEQIFSGRPIRRHLRSFPQLIWNHLGKHILLYVLSAHNCYLLYFILPENINHSQNVSRKTVMTIELNITGRLPLAGNLKPLVPSLFTHDQTKTFNLRENWKLNETYLEVEVWLWFYRDILAAEVTWERAHAWRWSIFKV